MTPHTIPDDEQLQKLEDDISALSNSQRLRLVHLLTRPRYGEEIAEALGMSRQAALKHIHKLEERGFVRPMHGRRDTGPVVEYQVVPNRLFALGVAIGDLGKLEPEGGRAGAVSESTMLMSGDEAPPRPQPAPPCAHLLVLDGPDTGDRVEIDAGAERLTIGRDDDRDVCLGHDPFVSGRHAEVHTAPRGHELVDAYSANGTFVNFNRLPKGGRVPLRTGDVITVGHTALVYQAGPE